MKEFGIYESYGLWDEKDIEEVRKGLAEANDMELDEVPDDWVYEDINDNYLADEKANLNNETGGVIVCYGRIGRWDGTVTGGLICGTNVTSIFDFHGCDEGKWFADKYNVRATLYHHDGRNHLLYRYVENKDKAEALMDRFRKKDLTEAQFMKATKSIRPFIAHVYGWKEYGRQKPY